MRILLLQAEFLYALVFADVVLLFLSRIFALWGLTTSTTMRPLRGMGAIHFGYR